VWGSEVCVAGRVSQGHSLSGERSRQPDPRDESCRTSRYGNPDQVKCNEPVGEAASMVSLSNRPGCVPRPLKLRYSVCFFVVVSRMYRSVQIADEESLCSAGLLAQNIHACQGTGISRPSTVPVTSMTIIRIFVRDEGASRIRITIREM
jgi:hypothetical protein